MGTNLYYAELFLACSINYICFETSYKRFFEILARLESNFCNIVGETKLHLNNNSGEVKKKMHEETELYPVKTLNTIIKTLWKVCVNNF